MASERIELPISDVCNVKQGRYLAPGEMSEIKTDGAAIPVIGANGVLGYTDQPSYTVPVTLITCRGSNCGLIQRTEGPTWISNNAMACPPKPPHDSLYLHYVLSSVDYTDVTTGSAQPQITTGHLNTKRITITRDLNEQKAIARILGTLDDKIELSRRMNATLEAMARALFQSWFVDFDPVHAKAAGRQPSGMDAATAALFPGSFHDSELGEIPYGWTVERLDGIADIAMGLSPAGDSYNTTGTGTPLINGPVEFGDYFPVKSKWTEAATRFSEAGDLIFCVRGSTTGRRVVSDGIYGIGRGVCAIRAKHGLRSFLYQTIDTGLDRMLEKTTGSVFPSLSAPDIKGFLIIKPPREILEAFERVTSPLIERIETNQQQSRTLAALRDTLLPKLLSGELPVTKVEANLEATA